MKRAKAKAAILILALAAAAAAAEVKEPGFRVEKQYRDFEVRDYDPYLVAEVEVKGTFDTSAFQGFQPLFEYIGGNNIKKEKIDMTAPVTQRPAEGEKIDMTAPVTQRPGAGGTYLVGFVMPAKYTLETIPEPVDPKVKIRAVPARRMAARTYSGSWSRLAYDRQEKILLDGMKREGLKPAGEAVFARYNHPGIAAWERRNEVLIEISR